MEVLQGTSMNGGKGLMNRLNIYQCSGRGDRIFHVIQNTNECDDSGILVVSTEKVLFLMYGM